MATQDPQDPQDPQGRPVNPDPLGQSATPDPQDPPGKSGGWGNRDRSATPVLRASRVPLGLRLMRAHCRSSSLTRLASFHPHLLVPRGRRDPPE